MGLWRWIRGWFVRTPRMPDPPPVDERQVGLEGWTLARVSPPETPIWLRVAFDKIGVREIVGSEHHPAIVAFHRAVDGHAMADEVPWCAAFVNWVLDQCRIPGTGSRLARSFLSWGRSCAPYIGCIVVLRRGEPWQGHVGFYMSQSDAYILVYGGNQSDRVCVKRYRKDEVLDYREPAIEDWLATQGVV